MKVYISIDTDCPVSITSAVARITGCWIDEADHDWHDYSISWNSVLTEKTDRGITFELRDACFVIHGKDNKEHKATAWFDQKKIIEALESVMVDVRTPEYIDPDRVIGGVAFGRDDSHPLGDEIGDKLFIFPTPPGADFLFFGYEE